MIPTWLCVTTFAESKLLFQGLADHGSNNKRGSFGLGSASGTCQGPAGRLDSIQRSPDGTHKARCCMHHGLVSGCHCDDKSRSDIHPTSACGPDWFSSELPGPGDTYSP